MVAYDFQSGGEWMVSLELENLLSPHDDVLEAAVIGIRDEKWDERPLAIIVPKKGAEDQVTADTMREHLDKFVSPYYESNEVIVEKSGIDDSLSNYRKYCRACALACSVPHRPRYSAKVPGKSSEV